MKIKKAKSFEEKDLKFLKNHIVKDPKICFGKPTIKGTRITVQLILELHKVNYSAEQIVEEYPHLDYEVVKKMIELKKKYKNILREEVIIMGMFDTIHFPEEIFCRVCGKGHSSTQTKEFENLLVNIYVGDMVDTNWHFGILKEEIYCGHRDAEQPIYIVIWNKILAAIKEDLQEAEDLLKDFGKENLAKLYTPINLRKLTYEYKYNTLKQYVKDHLKHPKSLTPLMEELERKDMDINKQKLAEDENYLVSLEFKKLLKRYKRIYGEKNDYETKYFRLKKYIKIYDEYINLSPEQQEEFKNKTYKRFISIPENRVIEKLDEQDPLLELLNELDSQESYEKTLFW